MISWGSCIVGFIGLIGVIGLIGLIGFGVSWFSCFGLRAFCISGSPAPPAAPALNISFERRSFPATLNPKPRALISKPETLNRKQKHGDLSSLFGQELSQRFCLESQIPSQAQPETLNCNKAGFRA